LNDVFLHLGIGLKIIDEAHTNFENMLMLDFYTNVYKSYYVTATPKRSNKSENRIYQLFMKNIPDIDLFNSESDPHTDYIAIKWSSRPSPYIVSNCTNRYGLDRNKYIDYVTKNDNFYKMMYIVMDMVLKCKGRVLMYIGTNEGILRVYKFIGTNYPELLGDIGIFTSLLDKEHKLLERNKKLLLSTTKSAGLGEHIEGLKMTIVVAEPFRSEVLARQSLGRTRDKDTTYIELVDLGFNAIKNFYYAKIPIFNKYALSTSDIYIDSYELENRYRRLKEERDEYISKCPLKLHDPRFFEYPKEEEFNIEAVREKFGLYDLK
jgi:rRNA pseudouridine-1189 N-methylase Emg1 (Nep1/Mra1 family)